MALMTELGIDAFFRMDYAAMRDFSRRALEAARALGDKQLMATPAGVLAFADVLDGALTEAETSIAEAAALVDGMSDEELARCRRATNNLACAEFFSDRYPRRPQAFRAGARGGAWPPDRATSCRSCSGRG